MTAPERMAGREDEMIKPEVKIPWMDEPGGLQSMGSHRVGHDSATSLSLFTRTLP